MENIWLQLCKHGFVRPMNHLHLPLTHLLLPDLVFLVKTQWKEGDCVSFNFLQCSKLFLKKIQMMYYSVPQWRVELA